MLKILNRWILSLWRDGLQAYGFLISIAVSLVISALSYGLSVLLAPKPPPIEGSRLDDLGAPVVNPGRPIPKATGRNIVKGQIIWATGIVETKHTKKVKGGKGGGKKVKVISYTYSISLAVAFNDGEICGVNRIIANGGKTVWSASFGTTLTDAQIQEQVTAKYNEVYASQTAIWSAVNDPVTGLPKYTAEQVAALADANATNQSEALRDQLTAANADIKPRYSSIEFYDGTETQEPSPGIEAFEGVGNVSAFRGTAYIVINDLELADFGNFTPSFEIDYATVGDKTTLNAVTTGADGTQALWDHWYLIDYSARKIFNMVGGTGYGVRAEMIEYDLDTLDQVQVHDLSTNPTGLGGAQFFGIDNTTGYLIGAEEVGGTPFLYGTYTYDPVTKTWPMYAETATYLESASDFSVQQFPVIYSADKSIGAFLSTDATGGDTVRNSIMNVATGKFIDRAEGPEPSLKDVSGFFKWFTSKFNSRNGENTAWGMWVSYENIRPVSYTLENDGTITRTAYSDIPRTRFRPAGGASDYFQKVYANMMDTVPIIDSDGSILYMIAMGQNAPTPLANGGEIFFKWSPSTDSVLWFTDSLTGGPEINLANGPFNETNAVNHRLDGNRIIFANTGLFATYPDNDFFELDLVTGDFGPVTELTGVVYGTDINNESAIWDDVEGCLITTVPAPTGYTFDPYQKWCWGGLCFVDPVSLGDIIRNFMIRAGYAATEYEIDAALDAETIWGFSDNTGRSTRDVLQDLAKIRPVIVNEIEGKLRFRLADQAVVATIPKEDVRAYDGSSQPPDWIAEVTTLEDLALPKTLRITYQDIDRALNPTTSIFTREVTQSTTVEEIAVQAVDTAESMRNSVFTGMSVLMTSKRSFKLSVPLKYSVLEPGDPIIVPVSDTRTAKVRMIEGVLGANNIIEIECALYIDTSLGIAHTDQFTAVNTDTAVGIPITTVFLLDIPYLTDEAEYTEADDTVEDNGVYVAFATSAATWPGVVLFVDQQTLTTENTFGVITQPTGAPDWQATIESTSPTFAGRVVLVPDATATALVQDTVSELVVSFWTPGAEFETVAAGSILSTQENAFLVGDEIIQAETVTLLNEDDAGLRTYQFSNLWRGLQGTEWAIGTQAVGDRVVYLDAGAIQRVDLGNPELVGLSVSVKAVTSGSDLTSTTTTTQVFEGASRKPYAPMIEAVVRDGSGNLTFELMQRNRYGSLWTPADPPFESDPDNFEVDIVIAGSPSALRTIVVSGSSTISYTAAEQTTDFGAAQSSISVAAYQLNADGRRGFAREETI